MTDLALWTLIASMALLAYIYFGFPLLLAVVGTVLNRRHRQGAAVPSISMIIAAYNEEACIAARLENALSSDYPPDLLQIIVASDGSTDDTVNIARACRDERVSVLELPRRGKIFALTDAVWQASGDVLVFSDANMMVEAGALRALVRNFADPAVGGVVGNTGYRIDAGSESSSRGESLYWRYDTRLKELESRSGSVVSAHGGLYAIRRELYHAPAEPAVTDDFIISTGVVAAGFRLVFEPAARAWEVAVPSAQREFQRRVRLMTRGLRAVACRRQLLNPLQYGFYSVVLFSHKVLRRLALMPLVLVFASSLVLTGTSPLFGVLVAAQLLFYGTAAAGHQLRGRSFGHVRLLYVPFFYCMANIAAFIAVLRFLRGDRVVLWQPQRNEGSA
jgi:cellulose synthase/poly-beta-1,6-N-acetylglucosamine synthase-like glycosyltransferase